MVCAKSSLPTPLSPRSKTVRLAPAMRRACPSAAFKAALSPTIFFASGWATAIFFRTGPAAFSRKAKLRCGPSKLAIRRRFLRHSSAGTPSPAGPRALRTPMVLLSARIGAASSGVLLPIDPPAPEASSFFNLGVGDLDMAPAMRVRMPCSSTRAMLPSRKPCAASTMASMRSKAGRVAPDRVRTATISSMAAKAHATGLFAPGLCSAFF